MQGKGILAFVVTLVFFINYAKPATAFEVGLTVNDPIGVSWEDGVVSSGIPLAQGVAKDVSKLRITDSQGHEVPAQFKVLSRWWEEDSSIRWILADFQASVIENGAAKYTLCDSGSQTKSGNIRTEETADSITVITGPLKFTVRKKNFNFIDQAWLDKDGDGLFAPNEKVISSSDNNGFVLEDGPEREVSNPSPAYKYWLIDKPSDYLTSLDASSTATIEESGSMKIVIRVDGGFSDKFSNLDSLKYCARIYAYSGKPYVRVQFMLKNSPPGTAAVPMEFFEGLALGVHFDNLSNAQYTVKSANTWTGTFATGEYLKLYQESPGNAYYDREFYGDKLQYTPASFRGYVLKKNSSDVNSGDEAEGLVALKGSSYGMAIGVKDFWQQAPKGIKVDASGNLKLELWPSEYKSAHWIGSNVHKTHEIFLTFYSDPDYKPGIEFNKFSKRLLAVPTPSYIESTGAWEEFGKIMAHDEQSSWPTDEDYASMASNGELGVMAWGGRRWEWGGGTFEPPQTLFQDFVETQSRGYFDRAEVNAIHWRDVRAYHTGGMDWEDMTRAGIGSDFYNHRYKQNGGRRWPAMDPSHADITNLIQHYYLTGERATADAIAEASEYYKTWWAKRDEYKGACLAANCDYSKMTHPEYWNDKPTPERFMNSALTSRCAGYAMRITSMAYKALGDKDNRGFASYLAHNWVMRNQDPVLGIYGGEVKGKIKPWMDAIIANGLAHVYEITHDEDIVDSLIGQAKWLSDDRLIANVGAVYEWVIGSVNGGGTSSSSQRIPGALAWIYDKTGIPSFLKACNIQASGLEWDFDKLPPKRSLGCELAWRIHSDGYRRTGVKPTSISDLTIENVGGKTVRLRWSAPSNATRYQIKYSSKPIVEDLVVDWGTLANEWDGYTFLDSPQTQFWYAHNVQGEPTPSSPGSHQSFTFETPDSGLYYFAIKSWHGSAVSNISNVVSNDGKVREEGPNPPTDLRVIQR